jgi:flagellar secretion chaperone FliS
MNGTIDLATIERLLDASPSRLLVMLFDEAERSLEAAIDAIARGDIEARCAAANKAIDIICHLYMTLDFEQGGAIADQLGTLYRFLMRRLALVNVRNDADPAREAIALLAPLGKAWRDVDERIEASIAYAEAMAADTESPSPAAPAL